jgi:predicted transcriptional regulator
MKKDSQSDSVRKALFGALSSDAQDNTELVDKVLSVLDSQKLLRYSNNDDINLLSTYGKVLIVLTEDPSMTARAVSIYLGLSETMVAKVFKSLISARLITKTKDKRQNVYKINYEILKNHSDIHHIFDVMGKISKEINKQETVDEEPF